jgi:hypothetical protein
MLLRVSIADTVRLDSVSSASSVLSDDQAGEAHFGPRGAKQRVQTMLTVLTQKPPLSGDD